MRILGLSITQKQSPKQSSINDFNALNSRVSELAEAVQEIIVDNRTVNTSIQRIERKQNRWLEIINERDSTPAFTGAKGDFPALEPSPPGVPEGNSHQLPEVGEELPW